MTQVSNRLSQDIHNSSVAIGVDFGGAAQVHTPTIFESPMYLSVFTTFPQKFRSAPPIFFFEKSTPLHVESRSKNFRK